MNEDGLTTKKNPYKGVWVVVLILIAVPTVCFFALRWGLFTYLKGNPKYLNSQAMMLAGLFGSVFCLMFVIMGGLKKDFKVVKDRICELVENWKYCGFASAIKWYLKDVVEGGVVFEIYLVLIGLNVFFCLHGAKVYFEMGGTLFS